MVVCLLIPHSHEPVRKRLLYESVRSQVYAFVNSKHTQSYLVERLAVPRDWVDVALALFFAASSLWEKAIEHWMAAKNFNTANSLFYWKVLPAYMNKSSSVGFLKALQQQRAGVTQTEKKTWIEEARVCECQIEIDSTLRRLFE